jgi:hypothetical protein
MPGVPLGVGVGAVLPGGGGGGGGGGAVGLGLPPFWLLTVPPQVALDRLKLKFWAPKNEAMIRMMATAKIKNTMPIIAVRIVFFAFSSELASPPEVMYFTPPQIMKRAPMMSPKTSTHLVAAQTAM